ncbi:PriCT-2 domain-containing protein [Liquorilactobacillus satsumensis]|nr:PriCT-2 domain-containing protein [Liquorilactobacillus satsumensis]MCP9360634.1 PriCT-2 domain-containing protein [Liquorilactobacillus satsumensis]
MENKFNLLPLLDYIDPSSLDYSTWAKIGMALKYEGYSVSDWEFWSRNDLGRYHDGECGKKWTTFDGANSPVTGATITQLAKDNGWQPHGGVDGEYFRIVVLGGKSKSGRC